MSWLQKKWIRRSDKNGDIKITQQFGKWKVAAGGVTQTSEDYGPAMWADALSRLVQLKPEMCPKRTLLLGLGAGSLLRPLYALFPNCTVVAVEYDSEMITIAKELGLFKPAPLPTIIERDAGVAIVNMVEMFDLIIFDLFVGPEPSALFLDPVFIKHLTSCLAPQGAVLANVLYKKEYLERADHFFHVSKHWEFGGNNLGAFWNNVNS